MISAWYNSVYFVSFTETICRFLEQPLLTKCFSKADKQSSHYLGVLSIVLPEAWQSYLPIHHCCWPEVVSHADGVHIVDCLQVEDVTGPKHSIHLLGTPCSQVVIAHVRHLHSSLLCQEEEVVPVLVQLLLVLLGTAPLAGGAVRRHAPLNCVHWPVCPTLWTPHTMLGSVSTGTQEMRITTPGLEEIT